MKFLHQQKNLGGCSFQVHDDSRDGGDDDGGDDGGDEGGEDGGGMAAVIGDGGGEDGELVMPVVS